MRNTCRGFYVKDGEKEKRNTSHLLPTLTNSQQQRLNELVHIQLQSHSSQFMPKEEGTAPQSAHFLKVLLENRTRDQAQEQEAGQPKL